MMPKLIIDQQKDYWNEAAKDPDVAEKYIANISLEDCLDAVVNHLLAGAILDIGCGIGRLTEPIAENAPTCKLYGVDISEEMLKLCPKSSVKYSLCNGFIPYPDKIFDSVYSMLTFQHINDIAVERYIKETSRVLKDNGVFRFQFVEGEEHNDPVDHNHKLDDVSGWLKQANFVTASINKGLVLPNWTWITAIKQ